MGRINFDLEDNKHQRFKTKASSEGMTITDVLTKFIDNYIGKWETKSNPLFNLEVGLEVKEKSDGIITRAELREVSVVPKNKQEIIDDLRDKISGIKSDNRRTDISEKTVSVDKDLGEPEYITDKQ
jgi:hypothetical protein